MRQNAVRWSRSAVFAVVSLSVLLSCDENLPSGPDTFPARLEIGVTSDTIIVGDSSKAQARAIGANGVLVSGLTFNWATSNSTTLGLGSSDSASARTRTLVGAKAGQSLVTLTLPDKRFVTTAATRNETVVVGGVKVLSSRDTTLSAINDTARAIAASLVKSNGALVNRASQGIRWIHLGTRTTVVGTGDTIRYIAKANGADTLIATHDFCLKSAKCADTVIARVTQVLTMSLSTHALQAWSFSDSLAPAVIVADRRGTGLAGTFALFIPIGATDSSVVTVTPVLGTTNPATGVIATPRLVSIANGAARVIVRAMAPDGSVIGTDTVSETVRQVARRVMVEPLSASLSVIDFIPYVSRARDARGAIIEDATTGVTSTGTAISPTQIGPNAPNTPASVATITPTLTGIALPANNPGAPQLPVLVLSSSVSLVPVDTLKAGATAHQISVSVFDSTGAPAVGAVVRFSVSHGNPPGAVITDGSGVAQVIWFTQDSTGSYTLTGVLDRPNAVTTADTAGTTVIRRSAVVQAGPANAGKSTVTASPTTIAAGSTSTITVTVNDFFNNPVLTTVPGDLSVSATIGTLGAGSCAAGVCTYTYTAPAVGPATATITAKLGTQSVLNSPLTITITP